MNPWVVRSPCTPACATEATPRVTAARIAQRYIALSGALALGAAQQRRLADPHIMRIQARNVLWALGVRIDASRTPLSVPVEPGGPGTLIVADHISWLDVLALLAVEPATLLAKREVERWPVFGSLATKAGARFIDRDRPRELPTTVADLAHLLRAGRSVMVFPQGTTWCSQRAGGFRRAMFQAAIDAGAPVRPVTISYSQRDRPTKVAAFLGDEGVGPSLHRVAGARDLTVRVRAHAPLMPAVDRRALAAAAQAAVCGSAPLDHA